MNELGCQLHKQPHLCSEIPVDIGPRGLANAHIDAVQDRIALTIGTGKTEQRLRNPPTHRARAV